VCIVDARRSDRHDHGHIVAHRDVASGTRSSRRSRTRSSAVLGRLIRMLQNRANLCGASDDGARSRCDHAEGNTADPATAAPCAIV
jgi:hypothetical protein